MARRVLAVFEDFFEIEYPLKKLDLIAIPDFSAGAMENWGLITFRTTALLYDARHSSAHDKQRTCYVVLCQCRVNVVSCYVVFCVGARVD